MILPRETLVVRESTAKSMRSNRSKDTQPELRLRKALWSADVRGYRKNVSKLPGRPDIVFGGKKLAVFVHGCYWHRCPSCKKDANFRTNEEFWRSKLQANVDRDARNRERLAEMGYLVLELWECEVKRDVSDCVSRIQEALLQHDTSTHRGLPYNP